MDLFNQNTLSNLLPYDGCVHYYGQVFNSDQAQHYFESLMEKIEWKHDEAVLYGKHYITKRKVAWYGNRPFDYTYSNTTKQALPWTETLKKIKSKVETLSGEKYNSCLLNLYHEGNEGMAYHSDDEKALGMQPIIASISLGAERKFLFKHKKTKQTVSIILEHGSLLLMKGDTQTNWMHRLPPTQKVTRPRINLTFSTMMA